MIGSTLNLKERQDSLNSSEQQNTPEQPHRTMYSDDEGAPHQQELSQKDFNDTKSEQLLLDRLAKKSLNRTSLSVTQNLFDMSVLQAKLTTDKKIDQLAQEKALQSLQAQQ